MKKDFNPEELLIIRKIIVAYLKDKENHKNYELLKKELEGILYKIECNLNYNILKK